MIEHAHEDHEIEPLAKRAHVIDGALPELDIAKAQRVGREPPLGKIARIALDPQHASRPPLLHLKAVEARVAADVEHTRPRQVVREGVGKARPFEVRIIAQKMVGCGPQPVTEVNVVEPGRQGRDTISQTAHAHPPAAGRPAGRTSPDSACARWRIGSTVALTVPFRPLIGRPHSKEQHS